jgi:hypothetical protein
MFSTVWYYYYRTTTVIQAVVALFTLSEKDLKAFFESYVIYDHDWANKEEMVKAFGPNYAEEVGKRLIDYYSVLNYLCAIGKLPTISFGIFTVSLSIFAFACFLCLPIL